MSIFTRIDRFRWAKIRPTAYSSLPNSDSDKDSEDGLLRKESLHYHNDQNQDRMAQTVPSWRNPRFITAHILLFSLYLIVLVGVVRQRPHGVRVFGTFPKSPAVHVLEYENREFIQEDRIQENGQYAGKPSAELDKAWHDLLNYENIRVEAEYMRDLGRENIGVAIPEGGGYIGTLNVYHEIHCLKRIHQFMYPEHYFPEFTPHQHEINRLHNEHCIDFLLQSVMCHGDIGLITFEWHDDSLIPVANATSHQCIKWDKLDEWTRARSVDMMKPGWLTHPTKGLAYPQGKGDKLGAVDNGPHLAGSHADHHSH